ncbi:MAG: hypothetical protein HYY43_05805 [Deltaproteobacteria bacterium]|nr:hypothetical protein [Deltaproteobacteria bacterium]
MTMRESWMTLQERQMIWLLRWWVGFFAVATIGFAFFPREIIYWLNVIGHVIFKWPYKTLSFPTEHFWQVLAVSLLCLLTYISFSVAKDIRQNLSHVKYIILSKFVTTVGFLAFFILSGPYFAYLAGAVIDFIILALTWSCYIRTNRSRGL